MFWRHYPDLWRWNPDVCGRQLGKYEKAPRVRGLKWAIHFTQLAVCTGIKGTFAFHFAHLAKCTGIKGTFASPFAHLAKCAGFRGTFASPFVQLAIYVLLLSFPDY
ncbi:hypothetical protein D3C75_1076500 [compost metagenome]